MLKCFSINKKDKNKKIFFEDEDEDQKQKQRQRQRHTLPHH
jgi:hypothetical protein